MAKQKDASQHAVSPSSSLAEICAAMRWVSEEQIALTDEEASLCRAREGKPPPTPAPLTDKDRVADATFRRKMNGFASPESIAPRLSREEEVAGIRVGLGRYLSELRKWESAARSREAAAWVRDHAGEWRALAHETVL